MGIRRIMITCGALSGLPLAASVGMREGFDRELPLLFYRFHGIALICVIAWIVTRWRSGALPGWFARRFVIMLVGAYAIASTRAHIAPLAIFLLVMAVGSFWAYTFRDEIRQEHRNSTT